MTLRTARVDELDGLVAIDDDACALYAQAGRPIEIAPDHPFAVAEYARWHAALEAKGGLVAVTEEDEPVGFAIQTTVDGMPHLQQLSVRCAWMRRGIGRVLVEHVLREAGERSVSLTTYGDLPWNRPAYERMGFSCVDESLCGEEMRHILAQERAVLPAPERRVAMISPAKRTLGKKT